MTRQRSILRGGTDYTGVSLQDIYEHLKEWRESTKKLLQNINEYKSKVIQNKQNIDRTHNIINFIDISIDLFNRFLSDFDRLLTEIPIQVTDSHIEIISQMYRRSEFHEQSCVNFKYDHIEKSLRDESMRRLLDNIYADTRDEIVNYSDLSNVMPRLRTYIGTGLKKSKRGLLDDTIDSLVLKPSIFGIGLNLNYLIKKVRKFLRKKEY